MGAVANATGFRKDAEFKLWVETAVCYVARRVIMGELDGSVADYPVRHRLAIDSAVTPGPATELFVPMIACDPSFVWEPNKFALPLTAAMEMQIVSRVESQWTRVARVLNPEMGDGE